MFQLKTQLFSIMDKNNNIDQALRRIFGIHFSSMLIENENFTHELISLDYTKQDFDFQLLHDIVQHYELHNFDPKKTENLVREAYKSMGYNTEHLTPKEEFLDLNKKNTVKFIVADKNKPVLTASVRMDSTEKPLMLSKTFPEIYDALREKNKLCEVTKFASLMKQTTPKQLSHLFQMILFQAMTKKCNMILVDVNPNHTEFYNRLVGFKPIAKELKTQNSTVRQNKYVNAPSVLMYVDIEKAAEIFDARRKRNDIFLYRYAFNSETRERIIAAFTRFALVKIHTFIPQLQFTDTQTQS